MIERLPFGRTGHESSRLLFGAAALGGMRQEKADEVLGQLKDLGINHIDTAASYGESELRLAPFLAEHRSDYFLATKTGERSGDAARAELERSLERMGVDSVDLIQLHNLVEEDEWQAAHAPGGAVEALAQARDEGLVRFIGVTGHGLRIASMHTRSLERFDFDSILLPYNYPLLQNDEYRRDLDEVLALAAERMVAVQAIKSIARRRWAEGDGPRFAWYEPLTETDQIRTAVHWAMSNRQLFFNSSSDARQLAHMADAASSPATTTSSEVMDALVADASMRPIFDGAALERI